MVEMSRVAISVVILLFSLPAAASAQLDLIRFLAPGFGKAKPVFQYQVSPYSNEEAEGQNRGFEVTQHNAFLSLPVLQDFANEWTLLGNFRLQDIHTSAILPDTREPFPESLWDIRLGTQYRRKFTNGWIGGGMLSVGSASDKPFRSEAELTAQTNLFARIPHGERNAWLLFLNYSRYREFLNDVPIPGIAYWYEPSSNLRLILGIPFASVEWKPTEELSLELSYFMIRTVRAQVSYRFLSFLRAYAGYDWRNDYFFRYDRQDKDRRLAYYEKRFSAGLRWDFSRGWFLDLGGGYAFDRFYFEAERYDDRDENRLNIANGFFGSLRLGAAF
jgi:hypothetical protein